MSAQAREMLAEFENLTLDEREYATDLIIQFERLVEDFSRIVAKH